MSKTSYVEGITAVNLRSFLELWAQLMPGIEEAMQSIIESNDLLFDENTGSFSWCHLYELPLRSM